MRYIGQRHNIRVPVSGLATVGAMREAFEKDYKRRYGHADAKAPAELQALHLSAFARLRRPDANRLPRPMADNKVRSRKVCFDPVAGSVDTRVYDRYSLPSGFKGEGPAVIEEYGSTTLVWPGDRFEIGPMHEIRVHCTQA
jgi:N-methylhydantoinase A